MSEPVVLSEVDARGVATVTLNRPEVNNAYNGEMIDALNDGVGALSKDDAVRIIVIRGNGRHFQAGSSTTGHRCWMIRSYALTFAAVTLRLELPLFFIFGGMEYPVASSYVAWLCWVPNLFIAELYLRRG